MEAGGQSPVAQRPPRAPTSRDGKRAASGHATLSATTSPTRTCACQRRASGHPRRRPCHAPTALAEADRRCCRTSARLRAVARGPRAATADVPDGHDERPVHEPRQRVNVAQLRSSGPRDGARLHPQGCRVIRPLEELRAAGAVPPLSQTCHPLVVNRAIPSQGSPRARGLHRLSPRGSARVPTHASRSARRLAKAGPSVRPRRRTRPRTILAQSRAAA